MASGVFAGALLVAGVLAAAGIAKLADVDGSRAALAEFGVPRRLASSLGALLPLAELCTAALLVAGVVGTAAGGAALDGLLFAGALSALALLSLFCAGIALSLVRGRAPDCHCFGQLHSAPASGRTLARNGILLVIAAFVAGDGEPTWTAAAGGAALALLGATTVGSSARRSASDDAAPDRNLPLGIPAPDFELPSLGGATVSLAGLRAKGRPVLLLFTDLHCGPCLALAPDVASWQRRHADELTIAVIENRNGEPAPSADEHGRDNVLLQRDGEVASRYGARGTPTAVLVGVDGEIASPVAGGAVDIEALVAKNVTDLQPVQVAGAPRVPEPSWHGGRLIRRELLLRGAGAWAATGAAMAWPLQAVAGVIPRRRPGRRCRREADCGRRQKCVGQGQNARCKCVSAFPEQCGGECVDYKTDDGNCGGCTRTGDPPGSICLRGRSTCVDGNCVQGNTDPANCSGLDCRQNTVCCEIPTETGAQLFGCMDLKSDMEHCGGCNQPCSGGKRPACCGGHCVDTHGDPNHCGGCVGEGGTRCEQGQGCYRGECVDGCPTGLQKCTTGDLKTCYHPGTEICCEGRVIHKDDLPKGSFCCNGKISTNLFACP